MSAPTLAAAPLNNRPSARRSSDEKISGQSKRAKRPQTITCEREIALITDYVSANLPPRLASAFEKHLEACRDCAAFLQTYKKTIEVTRGFLKLAPPLASSDDPPHRFILTPHLIN